MKRRSLKNQQTKIAAITIFSLLLLGCSGSGDTIEKDEQFCKCLKVTGDLNEYSSKMFDKETTIEDAQKMKALRDVKTKECKDYQEMSGDEMLKRKALCK